MTQCPKCCSYFKHVRRLLELPMTEEEAEMGCPAQWDYCPDPWHDDPRPARIAEIERAAAGAGVFARELKNELEKLKREWANA
jgi:hypothetical protein